MTESEYDLFCTSCGARIGKDTVYCPSCGARVNWQEGESGSNGYQPQQIDYSHRLKVISIVLAVSAGLLIIMGIYYLATLDSTMDALVKDDSWKNLVDMFKDYYSEQELYDIFKTSIMASAITYLVSGVFMVVSAICGFMKKYWTIGFICCIFATILSISGFVGLIIGIIVTYLYYTTRSCFEN